MWRSQNLLPGASLPGCVFMRAVGGKVTARDRRRFRSRTRRGPTPRSWRRDEPRLFRVGHRVRGGWSSLCFEWSEPWRGHEISRRSLVGALPLATHGSTRALRSGTGTRSARGIAFGAASCVAPRYPPVAASVNYRQRLSRFRCSGMPRRREMTRAQDSLVHIGRRKFSAGSFQPANGAVRFSPAIRAGRYFALGPGR